MYILITHIIKHMKLRLYLIHNIHVILITFKQLKTATVIKDTFLSLLPTPSEISSMCVTFGSAL